MVGLDAHLLIPDIQQGRKVSPPGAAGTPCFGPRTPGYRRVVLRGGLGALGAGRWRLGTRSNARPGFPLVRGRSSGGFAVRRWRAWEDLLPASRMNEFCAGRREEGEGPALSVPISRGWALLWRA